MDNFDLCGDVMVVLRMILITASYSDKRTVEARQVERFVIDEEKRVFWKYSSKTLDYRTAIL